MALSKQIEDDFEFIDAPEPAKDRKPSTAFLSLPPGPKSHTEADVSDPFVDLIQVLQSHIDRYKPFKTPLFKAKLHASIFKVYIDNIPEGERQLHTCTSCRHFLESYGDLCTVNEDDGTLVPLLWPEDVADVPRDYQNAIGAIRTLFNGKEASEDYQILTADDRNIGKEKTTDTMWTHFHFTLTDAPIITDSSGIVDLETATSMLSRICEDYDIKTINNAHHLLHEKLPYSTSHTPAIDWLQTVATKLESHKDLRFVAKRNLVKTYARQAWVGCLSSLRGGVIGELLHWVKAGQPYSDIESRWSALANPTAYLRPTAAPSAGNIEVAEKTLAQLGYTKDDLQRYWVATDELPESAVLWKNDKLWSTQAPAAVASGGIFSGLKKKKSEEPKVPSGSDQAPPTRISFRNFVRRVLPNVTSLEMHLTQNETATFFTRGATGSKSPFVFDSADPANTMSWYYWNPAGPVNRAGLKVGWNSVTSIVTFPHMWDYLSPTEALEWEPTVSTKGKEDGKDTNKWIHSRHGVRFLFCLQGAKETYMTSSLALFPTLLKNSFHGIRKTMEAFSSEGKIHWTHQDSDGKDQVGGLARDQGDWKKTLIRARTDKGVLTQYEITLFD